MDRITSEPVATHCPYCALQCGMNLAASRSGKGDLAVLPRPDFPTNKGGLCRKGWTSTELLGHSERLTTPLMRATKGDSLQPVTWDAALTRIASEIQKAQAQYGRDAAGIFGGGGLTNEKVYLLGKFARVALRTSAIDYNGRFCMSSAAAAGMRVFGVDRGLPHCTLQTNFRW